MARRKSRWSAGWPQGIDVIMDIDVQGALQIQKRCDDAVLIFLAAPSFRLLEQRLRGRGDTSEADVEKRLSKVRWEYSQAYQYDYIVGFRYASAYRK